MAAAIPYIIAATATYSAYQSYESSQDAKAAAKKQEAGAKRLAADEERNKLQTVMRNQKRRGAAGEPGLRDTILTGPLGIPNSGNAPAGKTLLGL
jgi:hypothetical protein